ncbi:MAG: hypothetical protein KDM91_18675, partial [Verrucomicrobiae bacterium]|nr:hypothetical protein [Verrucomicrobiae bacterium]
EAPPRQQDLFADIRKSLASEAPKLPVSFAETEEAFADSEEEEAFAEAEDDDDDFESPFILAEDDLDDDETDAEISRVGSIETPAFADEDEDEDFEAEAREAFVITELPNPVADAAAAEARTGLEAGDIGDEEAETEEGYYRTPFSEPRINPIALQTARLMAAASH